MEYRDQLKYIKSHGSGGNSGKGKRPKKSRKRDRQDLELWDEPVRKKKRKNDIEELELWDEPVRKKKKKADRRRETPKKDMPAKTRPVGKFLWKIQLLASAALFGSMAWLGIFSSKYMAAVFVLLVILLAAVLVMQRRAARRGKKKGAGKGLAFVASGVMFLLCFYMLKVNGALDKIAIGEEDGGYTEEHSLNVTEEPFNVYISGIDVYGEIKKESRSDVNLIATVNPKTHKILITTTPRDYYVPIPGVSGGQNDKLTHAGVYGIDTSIATLENLYETEIPFFVRVNFTSVEEIVDVMGGVDVESELAFQTGKEAGAIVDVKEGKNHFNGKEALAFVRERKSLAAGDNQRGKNQQALLTALIKKTMSPMILFRANGMINSVAGNAETNMAEAQLKSLIRMQLDDLEGWDIESVAATGDDSTKQYCYSYSGGPLYVTVPDWASVGEIKEKMKAVLGE